MDYHFNIEFATKYGVNEAIFCHNLYFWIKQNHANNKHIYDGNVWTYNTMEAYAKLFPFWTVKQVRTVIDNCKKKGLIVKGEYNKKGYDKTSWYALTELSYITYDGKPLEILNCPNGQMSDSKNCPNGQMDMPKWANGIAQMGTPIPDTKLQIKKTTNKPSSSRESIIAELISKNPDKPVQEIADALLEDTSANISELKQFKALLVYRIKHYQNKPTGSPKKATRKTTKTEVLPDWFDEEETTTKKPIEDSKPEVRTKEDILAKLKQAGF